MRKENSNFKTKFISEPGSYLQNRDFFAFVELEDCACYCIADGIDEDAKKESAKIAVSAIIEAFHASPGFSKSAVKRYLGIAHEELHRESTDARLEVSIVIILTNYKKVLWAHSGNSRLYFVRNEAIKYQTIDHSLSQNLANEGEIPLDQIDLHEERNNLYSYIGQAGRMKPTISKKRKLEDGDILILCTRGAWEAVGTAELLDALEGVHDPETVCTGLEDVILSQQGKLVDNYTIASIFIDKIYRNPNAGRNKKLIKMAVTIGCILLMIGLTITIVSYNKNKSNYKKMVESHEKAIQCMVDADYEKAETESASAVVMADKVRTGKKTKKRIQINKVKAYAELVKNMSKAKDFLTNGFYNNAEEYFIKAQQLYKGIKEEYQDQLEIEDVLKAYGDYAGYMEEAGTLLEAGAHTEATVTYEKARKAGETAGDMELQTLAEEKKKEATARGFIAEGDRFLEQAKKHFDAGEYTGALTNYQAAQNSYNTAKEMSEDVDVIQKSESAELGVANAGAAINNQTVQEKEGEAKQHLAKGDKQYKEGNYKEAIASYENAKTIYNDLNDSSMLSIVDSYIDKAQEQINKEAEKEEQEALDIAAKEEKAAQYLLEASELFSEGSYQKAIDKYSLAQDLYNEVDRKEEAKTLARIITSIQKIKKEREKEQEKEKEKE